MQKKKLSEFPRDARNPNVGRGNAIIERSIRDTGFRAPGVIDAKDRIVIGNHRADSAAALGMEDAFIVDVPEEALGQPIFLRYSDLDLEEDGGTARRITYYDNVSALESIRISPDLLREELNSGTKLTDAIPPQILVKYGVRNDSSIVEESSADRYESALARWLPVLGDVFYLPVPGSAPHILVCGDSTQQSSYASFDALATLLLTDPPYAAGYGDKQRHLNAVTGSSNRIEDDISNDSTDVEQSKGIWLSAFSECNRKLEDICSYYIFSSAGRQGQLRHMVNAIYETGFGDANSVIWDKGAQTYSRSDYKYQHEIILYGWREKSSHNFYGGFESSVLHFPRISANVLHPTQKPVDLLVYLIENSSLPGEIVLDPFIGSGSTLIAAEHVGRRCFGIEMEPKYVAVALDRWTDFTHRVPERRNAESE